MNRILNWNALSDGGNNYNLGSFYIGEDSIPAAARIHAEISPDVEDAEFDIKCNGVSIFPARNRNIYYPNGGVQTKRDGETTVSLSKGSNSEDIIDAFAEDALVKDTWITCNLINDGGGRNFSIQLEIASVEESL